MPLQAPSSAEAGVPIVEHEAGVDAIPTASESVELHLQIGEDALYDVRQERDLKTMLELYQACCTVMHDVMARNRDCSKWKKFFQA